MGGYTDNVANLPQAIYNDINEFGTPCAGTTMAPPNPTCPQVTGVTINAAFSDVRPEDAQYATFRALSARPYPGGGTCPTCAGYFNSTALGYGNWNNPYDAGPSPVLTGTAIWSSFLSTALRPDYFEQVPGVHDAFTNQTVGQYATYPVGALPIIISVSNDDTTAVSGLGNGTPGPYILQNVDRFVASYAFDGILWRTRHLTGIEQNLFADLEIITSGPLSGAYNTFEFNIPRSHDVQASQEDGVWPSQPNTNPLNLRTSGNTDTGGAILTINADLDYAFDIQGGITPGSAHCGQTGGSNLGLVGVTQ